MLLEAYMGAEITSIIILPSRNTVFMFGWSRKIMAYHSHPEARIICVHIL